MAARAIGLVAVSPAVLGVGIGLLAPSLPPIDLPTLAALVAVVLLVPVLTVVPVAARAGAAIGCGAPRVSD